MTEWIDAIGEAFFHIAGALIDDRSPRQTVGIIFGMLAAFIFIGTIVAVWIGTKLESIGWFVFIPLFLGCVSASLFCLLAGQKNG